MPPPRLEEVHDVIVVRDDDIPGGTKRRVLHCLLHGAEEFVYASPAYGYAQIALAYACADAGKEATIFTAKRAVMHARTREAKDAGAKIVMVPTGYMTNVQAKARTYAETVGAKLLPFGFDAPEVVEAIARLAKSLPLRPQEVWSVAGSGTLTRGLQAGWPQATFHAVRIGKPPQVGRARLYTAVEKFEQAARHPPPFASCANYDAKAWQFILRYARPGALFWNVAA